MGFDDRLIMPLVAVRTTRSDEIIDRDEYGQPVATGTVVTPFRGLIQPRAIREVAAISQAGLEVGEQVIYARPFDVIGADYIAHADPDDPAHIDSLDPRRYQVTGVRDAAGLGHHIEIDAHLVIAGDDVAGELGAGS